MDEAKRLNREDKKQSQALVGIISDTHDHLNKIDKALEIFKERNVNLIIHAGDFISPFALKKFKNLWCPFAGVFGNNEGEKPTLLSIFGQNSKKQEPSKKDKILIEPPLEYQFGEYLFYITHVPFDFKELSESKIYTAIIYGHTHLPDVFYGDTLIINPGECCGWVNGRATVALLSLPDEKVEIVDIVV